ncbi:zinc finger CCHC domain-containing protein 7-like isoform X3 [Adelges cooleyi]|nr:zinc finger CCHC domain-containing protein 7-like isoform X3 [Adelges cooleyi]
MDVGLFDNHSDCASDISETRSELEARIYSVIHHNDFSGTTEAPFVDPKYGVEFNANGEVVVYIKDVLDSQIDHFDDDKLISCNNRVIPTIVLDDDDDVNVMESTQDILIAENEFIETSLKKKKKKKKNKVKRESIDKYIELVKNSDVLKEYRVKSGLDEMNTKKSNKDDLAMNVGFQNERAIPMTRSEVLKQYRIGKPTEDTTWYRCPKTWTSDMVKFYTKIQKSKRNFDCAEELKKIRETQGSNPIDWTLDSSDLYKSYSNTPRIKCNYCRQYGHKAFNCKEQYKPQVCIMCGLEGHNLNSCDKQLCFT